MIHLMPCETKTEDVTGVDWVRIVGKVADHNAAGRLVIVGFGAEPKFVGRKGEFYKLVKVSPAEFRMSLPKHEEAATMALWDGEGA